MNQARLDDIVLRASLLQSLNGPQSDDKYGLIVSREFLPDMSHCTRHGLNRWVLEFPTTYYCCMPRMMMNIVKRPLTYLVAAAMGGVAFRQKWRREYHGRPAHFIRYDAVDPAPFDHFARVYLYLTELTYDDLNAIERLPKSYYRNLQADPPDVAGGVAR